MEKLRMFETPIRSHNSFHSKFPVLNGILDFYCNVVVYWKVYTINHTTVIMVRSSEEIIILLGNKKQRISIEEIDFVKKHLFDSDEIIEISIDRSLERKLEREYDKEYKDIFLLKQSI